MQVHCIGGQRGGRHRSVVGVGFLRLSHPPLVFILFSAPSLLQMKFFQKLFPLVNKLMAPLVVVAASPSLKSLVVAMSLAQVRKYLGIFKAT